jgi:hypothetical protein
MLMAAVPAVVLAAACSSAGPAERVAAAPARTVAEGSARVTQRLEIVAAGPDEGAEPSVTTAEGTVDFDDHEGTMTVSAAGETFDVVIQGTTVYQHLPEVAAAAGREWIRIDLDELAEAVGVDGLAELVQSQSNDPSAGLQYLRGASDAVRTVGKESIRGARTTWYEATVDVEKAAAGAPVAQQETIRSVKELFGIATIPTDVWIDGDGRVRRLKQSIDYSSAGRSGRFPAGSLPRRMDVTVEFYDFGTPVSVTIPPAEEVAGYGEILDRARKGQGSGTATPETDALVPRLLAEVPAGYEQQPDNVGDTGPSDFEKAVRDEGSPDARRVLEADGFVAGYQRLWTRDEDGTIIDFVYRFSAPGGAEHYRDRTLASFREETEGAQVSELSVPDVPGARGVRIVEDDEHTAVVFVARNGFLGQIVVIGPDAATDAVPVALARQQYERFG